MPTLAAVDASLYRRAHGFGLDRFVAGPLVIAAGFARAPGRPGHGIEFDWEGLQRVRCD